MSEHLSSGLEDFEEELIHIDYVGQTKLWVMILKWDSVERKLRSTCLSWESFVFLSNMFSFGDSTLLFGGKTTFPAL